MGYFDGLASGIIKKDVNNNSVYYPWGVLGKGFVLPDDKREAEIKSMVILFYQLFFAVFVLFFILFKHSLSFGLSTLGLLAWFLYKSKQLTKDCPKSQEKLTLKEGYTNSAKAHNKTVLWILFGVSVLFALGAIVLLFSGKTLVLGIFGATLFGASSAAIFYMIQVKNKQENS